jgi:hypothetical protein
MDIKLKGKLSSDLRYLGLKPGDIINEAEQVPNSVLGTVRFKILRDGEIIYRSITRENYEKL